MSEAPNKVDVVIDGQTIKLTSAEDEEYVRKVAEYIDFKISEITRLKQGKQINVNTRWLLVTLNITDELFKAVKKISALDNNSDNLNPLQEENLMLRKKTEELEAEVLRLRQEFSEYLEAFGNP